MLGGAELWIILIAAEYDLALNLTNYFDQIIMFNQKQGYHNAEFGESVN